MRKVENESRYHDRKYSGSLVYPTLLEVLFISVDPRFVSLRFQSRVE
jgi:hypothetical protein